MLSVEGAAAARVLCACLVGLALAACAPGHYEFVRAEDFVPKPKPLDCNSIELVAASDKPDDATIARDFVQIATFSSDDPVTNRDTFLANVRGSVCAMGGDVVVFDVRDATGASMRPVSRTGETGGKIVGGVVYRSRARAR